MIIIERLLAVAPRLVQPASAHCDTEDGPVVTAGRQALATGNVNHALPWVPPEAETEVLEAFGTVLVADDADHAPAERAFLETLVRVHRLGEGAAYDGIKPAGTPQPPAVTAADEAIAEGDLSLLAPLVEEEHLTEVAQHFATTLELGRYDVDDIAAGRDYVGAYVEYVHHAADHAVGAAH